MKKYSYKNSDIEWLGNIPKHWNIDRIKDKTLSVSGGDWGTEPKEESSNNIAVIRVADLDGIYFNLNNLTIRDIKETSYKSRKITDKSLIIEKSGGGEKQLVGRVGYPKGLSFKAICSNFMANIILDNSVDIKYINYVFSALYSNKLNLPFVQQTTGIQNLNVTYYLTTKIAFPPIKEQKAIAEYLDNASKKIDRVIAIKKEQLEKLEMNLKSKIQEVTLSGLDKNVKTKPVKSDWINEIPQHWRVKKVKRICNIFRGKFTHRPRNDPDYYNGKYPFIQTGNISNAEKYITSYSQTLNELGLSVSELFPSGTLTMTIAANIGDMAILTFDACFPDSIVGLKPYPNIDLEFLYYQFIAIKQDFLSNAIVTTQMNLNINRIGIVDCYIPPLKEQKDIVKFIEDYSDKILKSKNVIQTQIKTLQLYRKSLIHECVTGKKQVADMIE